MHDITSAICHPRLWATLSFRSVKNSYRRTYLGPWWHSVDQLLFTLGFGLVNSWLFGSSLANSLTYVGLGILGFSYISQTLLSGSQCLVTSTQLRYAQVPLASRMFKSQLESLIVFSHRILSMLVILAFTGGIAQIKILESIFGLALLMCWGLAVSLALGPIGARFRDVQPMVNLLLRLALFATPIFWSPDDGANNQALMKLANWNPFALLLELIRSPLLGQRVPALHIAAIVVLVIATAISGLIIFSFSYRRIQYWL